MTYFGYYLLKKKPILEKLINFARLIFLNNNNNNNTFPIKKCTHTKGGQLLIRLKRRSGNWAIDAG
jgi:hypothetical protein